MGCGTSFNTAQQDTSQSNNRSNHHVISRTANRPPRSAQDGLFAEEALKIHNEYRLIHGVPPLTLSDQLTSHAHQWAEHIASKDMMLHGNCFLPGGGTLGENIYTCWAPPWAKMDDRVTARAAVRAWYNENDHYDFGLAKYSIKTGHFTQLIWKSTRELGIAQAMSSEGTLYIVANYRPVGNVVGYFNDNVPALVEGDFQRDVSPPADSVYSSAGSVSAL